MISKTAYTDKHDNLERWLLTYADMITLLTAFFLMMYSMSVVSRGKFSALATSVRSGFGKVLTGGGQPIPGKPGAANARPSANAPQYEESMRNLSQYVEQHRLKGLVNTRMDARGVVISLVADNMLFERGQARLQSQNAEMLAKISQILGSVPNDIEIEGHTCDLPIHSVAFPSNWELSAGRASVILREFTERYGLNTVRFRAAGYADTKPLVSNDSEENRARNRRVDIVILKTDSQRESEVLRKSEIQRITASPGNVTEGTAKPAPPQENGPTLEP